MRKALSTVLGVMLVLPGLAACGGGVHGGGGPR